MMDFVIGCDIGSQSAKAVLLSFEGTLAGEASQDYAIDYPHPLWAEQPVARWTEALITAVRRLLTETGAKPASVRALGLATQVDGVVPIDADGNPLHPAIIWMDRRARAQCEAIRQAGNEDAIFRLTGLNLDATHVAPKIRWLADHHPDLYDRAAYFLLPGSYMAFYLTGETAVDYSNASSTLLFDVRTKSWSPEMCALFGIEIERLAPVSAATAVLGTLRPTLAEALGLHAETRVVIGSGDEHAASLGAGVVRPGLVADIAGTAEPVCAASPEPIFDSTRLVETHCHADPGLWLLENPGFVSGGNLRWYRDHFQVECEAYRDLARTEARAVPPPNPPVGAVRVGAVRVGAVREPPLQGGAGGSPYQRLDAGAARVPPGAEGLIFLPCLMGAMAPTWNDAARGTFCGFTLAHTRDHFTRAILEGSAYAVRDITDQMRASGLSLDEMRVVGGGAKSRLWNQIKADVTGLPVAVPHTIETTALGAALLALAGVGAFATPAEACDCAVRIAERFDPRPETRAAYEDAYAHYRDLYFTLSPVFERAAPPPPAPPPPSQLALSTQGRAGEGGGRPTMTRPDPLSRVRCFLLDLDGTFYLGEQLIEGALRFVETVQAQGRAFLFLTNNSSRDARQYAEKITRLGLPIPPEKVLTSGAATAMHLQRLQPGARLFVVGTPALEAELERRGFQLTNESPDFAVLGFDTTLTYAKLWRLCDLVRAGVPYVATHPDLNCPTAAGYMPDIGATIAFVRASTGRDPELIIGKPNRLIVEAAAAHTGVPVTALCMIGDRLYTDIALGAAAGIPTILVLSGETRAEDVAGSLYQPDYIFPHLGAVADDLLRIE